MPFTPNRAFKRAPRLIARAKDMHYFTPEGREVLDGTAGLWCTNAGHNRDPIVAAIKRQAEELDYSPAFQFAHPKSFELASRVAALAPGDLDRVFFCNSGSEAVDTALKIALAYHNVRGEGARTRLIGRERGYHGVGFGGISVGGIVNNRKISARCWPASITCRRPITASIRPSPRASRTGARISPTNWSASSRCTTPRPSPPSSSSRWPARPACCRRQGLSANGCARSATSHGILLIFDEVITGFGRLGYAFAAERYGVMPDMIAFAKGVTSGAVPMGGVIAREGIYDAFMHGPEHAIELFHGYTYSAHPLACAAGLATLDLYRDEDLFERAKTLEPLRRRRDDAQRPARRARHPHRRPCRRHRSRLAPRRLGKRAYEAMERGFHDEGLMIRVTGDTLALSPPLIVSEAQIGEIFDKVGQAIKAVT